MFKVFLFSNINTVTDFKLVYIVWKLQINSKKWPNVTTVHSALSGNGGYFEGLEVMYCVEGYEKHSHHLADQTCSFEKKHVLKYFPKSKVMFIDIRVYIHLQQTVVTKDAVKQSF